MRTLIIYYSRTGTTRTLAEALATELKGDIDEIRCERYRPGGLRYLRAGYDSLRGNLPPIVMPAKEPSDYDLVLIGGPIWTSYPALPIRAYLDHTPDLPARIAVFLTFGAHSPPQKAIEMMTSLLPRQIEAALTLSSDDVNGEALPDAVRGFAAGLLRGIEPAGS